MKRIGGNTSATLQVFTESVNTIGEAVRSWSDAATLNGFLDLMSETKSRTALSDFIADSTHVFICDYEILPNGITNDNCQMVIGGETYSVQYIDDPMNLHYHFEFYLKKSGWQN